MALLAFAGTATSSKTYTYKSEARTITPLESLPEKPKKEPIKQAIVSVSKYDWDESVARAVILAESGGNPNAVNWKDKHKGCTGSFGLFQLACLHGTQADLLDPIKNKEIAYKLWKRTGWRSWSVCTTGKVKCW